MIGQKREPRGRETRETRPWPEACEVYSRRDWRLLAVTGKAGSAWSEVVLVDDIVDAVDLCIWEAQDGRLD